MLQTAYLYTKLNVSYNVRLVEKDYNNFEFHRKKLKITHRNENTTVTIYILLFELFHFLTPGHWFSIRSVDT